MTSLSGTDIFAQVLCVLSMVLKLQLLLLYKRLPREQKNFHSYLLLISSLCFATVSLFLSFGDFISNDILRCTSIPTIVTFVLFQNVSDASLVGYGMAFFLRFKSLTVVMIAMIGALFCSSLELVLTYNSETNVLPCHGSFVSSNSGALAVVAVQMILLIVIVVLLVAALMCKHKEEHDEQVIAGSSKSAVSILVVGALATVCVIILSISHHQSTTYLFTYSNLTIIYSTKSCLISVLAVVTCPISKAMLRSLLTNKKMKAKVNTVPRDQLYCSIALRNPPKVRENTSQNLASTGEINQPSSDSPPTKTVSINESRSM
ncbi:hypothetical protein V3C99_013663 [Haemonchus contortus]